MYALTPAIKENLIQHIREQLQQQKITPTQFHILERYIRNENNKFNCFQDWLWEGIDLNNLDEPYLLIGIADKLCEKIIHRDVEYNLNKLQPQHRRCCLLQLLEKYPYEE